MSSEDQVKEQLGELLGTVEREEAAEWLDSAKIRLDPDQAWDVFLTEQKLKPSVTAPLVIICASGQRCADVLRLLHAFRPDLTKGHTAKTLRKTHETARSNKTAKKGRHCPRRGNAASDCAID